jgi:putative phosphoribosyl transferase
MIKFPSPAAAGRELAVRLQEFKNSTDTIVVAILSGGLFVAAEVARELALPLEFLFIRRLTAPFGPHRVLCAVSIAGTLVVDDELLPLPVNPANGLEYSVIDGIRQLEERERFCRAKRQPTDLSGKHVILVDNGIHTGGTMDIAIRALRKLHVSHITVATPVADANSRDAIERAADQIFCLNWPEKFGHAGLWYKEFVRPTNEEILNLYLHSEETMNER